jgi:hypothetical protein
LGQEAAKTQTLGYKSEDGFQKILHLPLKFYFNGSMTLDMNQGNWQVKTLHAV